MTLQDRIPPAPAARPAGRWLWTLLAVQFALTVAPTSAHPTAPVIALMFMVPLIWLTANLARWMVSVEAAEQPAARAQALRVWRWVLLAVNALGVLYALLASSETPGERIGTGLNSLGMLPAAWWFAPVQTAAETHTPAPVALTRWTWAVRAAQLGTVLLPALTPASPTELVRNVLVGGLLAGMLEVTLRFVTRHAR
ncbi:hypothetical protein [Deinococcus radiotolerans]|uniref:Uncharacterized protein n=1 Tax=Deinococcus radiotolerans TaxID=1309407 RepID=A0ABQ2FNV9_9DEIO|nr:hypothetical protein [Deinococcus radiotolerans]GGL12357.1 hypothetical protein GCM10010844_33780 [Deinococcus radiotolerans]